MARQRDYVWDNYYVPYGSGFKPNTTNDLHALTERMYMRHLTELSMNRFKWEGLPKSIDSRFIELQLTNMALAVFYWDERFNRFLCVAASPNGGLNMYQNPIGFTTYGNRMQSKQVKAADVVPIWSNMLRTPDLDIVTIYSKRLAEMDTTIRINSKNLRKTKMVYATENTRLSYANIIRQHDEGVEAIYGVEDAMNPANIQVLDLGGDPVGLLNLMIAKSKLWNECMTMLGINNANQDKKERLISGEVESNDEQVFATRGIALNERKRACELINEKFKMPDGTPLNVSVDYNSESNPVDPGITNTTTLGLTESGAGQ